MSELDSTEIEDSFKEEIDALRHLLTSLSEQGIDVQQVIRDKLATEFTKGWFPDEDLESEVEDMISQIQPIWQNIFKKASQREDILIAIREMIEEEFSKAWEDVYAGT